MSIKKPTEWHGVQRGSIEWHPTVDQDLCFGCVTCANTCPTHAIGFPSLNYLHKIIKKGQVV